MKILIATDASPPQINGVVRTHQYLKKELQKMGHEIMFINNSNFKTFPLPHYKEISIAWNIWKVKSLIEFYKPDYIHIATIEAPIGFSTAIYCKMNNIPFSSSYHTRFPEFIKSWISFAPINLLHRLIKKLHNKSTAIMVPTESMKHELINHGYNSKKLHLWSRGVDISIFNSKLRNSNKNSYKFICVSRVSEEKNLEKFFTLKLDLDKPYELIMVGDGPSLKKYSKKYPQVNFLGYKIGKDLAYELANSDVFVFPSLLDTFGLVMLEANACGTPVAAYPVTGPIDVIKEGLNGSLNFDLEKAIQNCLSINRNECEEYCVTHYSWKNSALQFIEGLQK